MITICTIDIQVWRVFYQIENMFFEYFLYKKFIIYGNLSLMTVGTFKLFAFIEYFIRLYGAFF
jgi:hypothetical protein